MEVALKYVSVYILSGVKFIFGPILGATYELPLPIVILLTSLGMMTTIYLFTLFGESIRRLIARFKKNKKIFTKKNKRFVVIWRKFGLVGVCLLTPIFLSPIGGGILVNMYECNKKKILKWMWISSLGWSFILSIIVKYGFWLGEKLLP